jgi:MoxR-like ATPase
MNEIVGRTTTTAETDVTPIIDGPAILRAQRLARRIVVAPHVQDYVIRLVLATHPGAPGRERMDAAIDRYIRVGVSPRGAQALISAGKVKALIDGRYAAAFRDITGIAPAALRHRIIRSFEAEADGMTTDDIIARLIQVVPRDGDASAPGPRAAPSRGQRAIA